MWHQYKKGDNFPIEVQRVIDGDRLEVRVVGAFDDDGNEIVGTVQLYGIDAPELTQRYGPDAKAHLEGLVQDARLWLHVMIDVGDDCIVVGDVYRNSPDKTVSQDMVKAGWAYSRRYGDAHDFEIEGLEQQAYFNGVGVWQEGANEVRPWDYRDMLRDEEDARIQRELDAEEERVRKYNDYCEPKRRAVALKVLLFCGIPSVLLLILVGGFLAQVSLIITLISAGYVISGVLPESKIKTSLLFVGAIGSMIYFELFVRYPLDFDIGGFWVYLWIGALLIFPQIINKLSGILPLDEWDKAERRKDRIVSNKVDSRMNDASETPTNLQYLAKDEQEGAAK